MKFAHLAQKLFNTPLAIHPAKAEVIVAALAERLGIASLATLDGRVVAFDQSFEADESERRPERPYAYDVVGGVAVIPIEGTTVQKLGTLSPFSGMTGYDGIRQNFLVALEDPAVEAIAFDIDSPGGDVAGCFDLVDTIYAARGEKPIAAILSESAYSAAYALASAVDPGRLFVPRTGGSGSVGVLWLHCDISKALDKDGLNVTMLTYGDRKAETIEILPLSDQARKAMLEDIGVAGDLFVDTVARNRGLKPSAVRATQAATFMGQAGVDIGFADAVASPDQAFRQLLQDLDSRS